MQPVCGSWSCLCFCVLVRLTFCPPSRPPLLGCSLAWLLPCPLCAQLMTCRATDRFWVALRARARGDTRRALHSRSQRAVPEGSEPLGFCNGSMGSYVDSWAFWAAPQASPATLLTSSTTSLAPCRRPHSKRLTCSPSVFPCCAQRVKDRGH